MKTATKNTPDAGTLHIRWLIRADMKTVQEIEDASFEFPWDEDAFIRCLRQRNCIGIVGALGERVVAYAIYELHKDRLHILNLAVDPKFRRLDIGAEMVRKLVGKLSAQRRTRITLEVRETNLDAQLFFRAQGFRAISVLRKFFDATDEDAYLMQYRLRRTSCE